MIGKNEDSHTTLEKQLTTALSKIKESEGKYREIVGKHITKLPALKKVAVVIDITERKKTEEKLQFSDAAFQSIQESVIATNLKYTITYWNEASERIYGIKAAEALGNKLTDIVEITETYPGESAERIRMLETEGRLQEEQLHKTKKNVVWVNVSFQEIKHEGQRMGWIVLATDISRQKIAEKNLRENQEFLINILESMSDGVLALNRDFQYTYWNKGMEQLFKISRLEILSSEKLPLKGAGGQIRGVVGVVQDITERKNVELALKKSEENLRNLSRHLEEVRENERTNIARKIHDELGQSLTALKMDISWLQKKFLLTNKEFKKKTGSMIDLTDRTIQTIKKISSDLRPGLLDDLGLIPALEWQAEEFHERFGIMGIRERVLGLGGESLIQGIKDKGTTVTVQIPAIKTVPLNEQRSYKSVGSFFE